MRPFLLLPTLLLVACQSVPQPRPEPLAHTLPGDTRAVETLEDHEADLEESFLEFRKDGDWPQRGYFNPRESDRAELLLFRLHTAHHQLADISDRYRKLEPGSPGYQLHLRAHRLAVKQASFLVETFSKDPLAITQLNEAYPRSHLPRHTYDQLAESLERFTPAHLEALQRKGRDSFADASYAVKAEVFYRVSRLKLPGAHLVRFSDVQKAEVLSHLRPGDIILTYTAGYASDVFIPGAFKHALTFVGTPSLRAAEGLTTARLENAAGSLRSGDLTRLLRQTRTTSGREANLIEAVAEGVKFSNLAHIMDTHINRFVVLRPNLTTAQRATFLGRIFSYLGQDYDFHFDFADASRQVCTELTWRALSGLEDLQFTLTRRGGHLNLSADDIVHHWLEKNPQAFQCILYAEEAPLSPGHRARLRYGPTALPRLETVMAEEAN